MLLKLLSLVDPDLFSLQGRGAGAKLRSNQSGHKDLINGLIYALPTILTFVSGCFKIFFF